MKRDMFPGLYNELMDVKTRRITRDLDVLGEEKGGDREIG